MLAQQRDRPVHGGVVQTALMLSDRGSHLKSGLVSERICVNSRAVTVLATALAVGWLLFLVPAGNAQDGPQVDVALDPGHSYVDVGAVGSGLREVDLTLDLAQRVRADLQAGGFSVRLTREDDQPLSPMSSPDLVERTRIEEGARISAGLPARVFVSLHFNGGPPSLGGTETFYNPDRAADGTETDADLAQDLQQEVIAALASIGYTTQDRGASSDLTDGKSYGHFFSLRGPVPSALVESLFLTNATEAGLLKDGATLDALAGGISRGLEEYLRTPGQSGRG